MDQHTARRTVVKVPRLVCAFALAALALTAFSARPLEAADGDYHLLKKVVLGGEGFWDYLTCDSDARRVYISRGSHVMVVDADTYAVMGDIPDTDGVHGIALAPEFGRGFTSNGRSNTVTIFDLKTLKVLGTAPTGEGPDAIVYDPASKRVFTLNGHAGTATAIDAASGKPVGTVTLGGRPEFAAADGQGHVYNNLEDKSQIVQIDSQKLTVTATWPLAPGDSPSGLAMDRHSTHGRVPGQVLHFPRADPDRALHAGGDRHALRGGGHLLLLQSGSQHVHSRSHRKSAPVLQLRAAAGGGSDRRADAGDRHLSRAVPAAGPDFAVAVRTIWTRSFIIPCSYRLW